jgi:outer membrane protein with beta-barrel domain
MADTASLSTRPLFMTAFAATVAATFIVTLVAMLAAGPLSAQESTTRGFVVGAHVGLGSVSVEGSERSSGGGGGLMVGYGINRRFTIYAQLDGATIDVRNQPDVEGSWAIGFAELGVRFNFANSLRSWVPYVQTALGARAVSISDIPMGNPASGQDVSISGGAFSLGGGVMLYPTESLAFDIGAIFTGGQFTTLTVGANSRSGFDVDANSSRFNLGVVWWP